MISHVLVIENHRLMRDALKGLLETLGIQRLEVTSDPVEAMKMVVDQPPQLVVLDASPTWSDIHGLFLSRMLRAVAPKMLIALLVDDDLSLYDELKKSSGADFVVGKDHLAQNLAKVLDGNPFAAGC